MRRVTTTQWCLAATALLALIALATAARLRAVTRTLRGRLAAAEGEADGLRERLAAELADRRAGAETAQREQEINAATRRAFLSVARRILVMAHDQQAGLDEMERTHDDPVLLEGLLRADHAAAQQARLAQTLAVLCGSRAGRQWPEPVSLEDVVRGAQSRILPFQRVVVNSRVDNAVLGAAAEALIHAVAELLDNATRYSPPSSQVYVTLLPVHNGAVIEIDDCGVGMTETTAAKAAAALAGGGSLEVSRIGEVPQLGLAAVGRLADQYGFRVTVHSAPSPYGGVRVVVLLPSALLTDALPAPAPARPEPHSRPALPPEGGRQSVPAQGGGGLPRRVNRRGAANPQSRPEDEAAPVPPRSAREAQAFMSLFQAGTASGRSAAQDGRRSGPQDPWSDPQDRWSEPQDRRSGPDRHDAFPASPQLPQRSGDSHDDQP